MVTEQLCQYSITQSTYRLATATQGRTKGVSFVSITNRLLCKPPASRANAASCILYSTTPGVPPLCGSIQFQGRAEHASLTAPVTHPTLQLPRPKLFTEKHIQRKQKQHSHINPQRSALVGTLLKMQEPTRAAGEEGKTRHVPTHSLLHHMQSLRGDVRLVDDA